MKNTHSFLNKFLRVQETKRVKIQEELVGYEGNLVPNRVIYRKALKRLNKIKKSKAGIGCIRRIFWGVVVEYEFNYFRKYEVGDVIIWKDGPVSLDW